jgi:hypothetical protein
VFCQSLFVILYFFLSSLHYLSYDLRLLVTTLVSCGHCVVCHLRFTASDLPLWYLVAIVLSVIYDLRLLIYHFGILWPLCCLSSTNYGFWFTTLVSCGHCVVCHLPFTASDLPLWYLVAIVLSVIYDLRLLIYHFGTCIFKRFCR